MKKKVDEMSREIEKKKKKKPEIRKRGGKEKEMLNKNVKKRSVRFLCSMAYQPSWVI